MLALLFAQRVILGKQSFLSVPEALKAEVKKLLEENGLGALAE